MDIEIRENRLLLLGSLVLTFGIFFPLSGASWWLYSRGNFLDSFHGILLLALLLALFLGGANSLLTLLTGRPLLRATADALYLGGTFGRSRRLPWNQVGLITVRRRKKRDRYRDDDPWAFADFLEIQNDQSTEKDGRTSFRHNDFDGKNLEEVVLMLKRHPIAATKLDRHALTYRYRSALSRTKPEDIRSYALMIGALLFGLIAVIFYLRRQ